MGGAELTEPLSARALVTARALATLAVVVAIYAAARASGFTRGETGPIFALGFLLLAGHVAGTAAAFLRLPRLTGYLAAGIISGPHVAHVLDQADVKALSVVNALALALIALEAGAELTVAVLRRYLKTLAWQSLTHTLVLGGGMTVVFVVLALVGMLPFLEHSGIGVMIALGAVWGALSTSKSPAATLAILKETRSKGAVSDVALGVVVVFDIVVLVLFAAALVVASATLRPGAELSLSSLEALGVELIASVAAGTTLGVAIAFYFWAVGKERLLFVLVTAYGVTAFCTYFHYDTLLVFATAGFAVSNLTRQGHALVRSTEQMGSVVMIVFFATAGAQLDVEALKSAWLVALLLAGARIAFTWLASWSGHVAAHDEAKVRRYAFTAHISQAGVTIGLITVAQAKLGEQGAGIATLAIAVIGINQVLGPIVFKIGLARAGEVGKVDESDQASS